MALFINGCVSLSIGEKLSKRAVNKSSNTSKVEASVYASENTTMMAINHIIHEKRAPFEKKN